MNTTVIDLALVVGPERLDVAIDETELHAAWSRRRASLLTQFSGDDFRPWAWWVFDRGEPMPPIRDQPARLAALPEVNLDGGRPDFDLDDYRIEEV